MDPVHNGPHIARGPVFLVIPQMLAVAVREGHRKLRACRAVVAVFGIALRLRRAFVSVGFLQVDGAAPSQLARVALIAVASGNGVAAPRGPLRPSALTDVHGWDGKFGVVVQVPDGVVGTDER